MWKRAKAGTSCQYERPAVICSAKLRQTVVSVREEEGERAGVCYGSEIRQKRSRDTEVWEADRPRASAHR